VWRRLQYPQVQFKRLTIAMLQLKVLSHAKELQQQDESHMTLFDEIRAHYDAVTPLYKIFWGEHIHHGYWEKTETAREAQEKLIRILIQFAGLTERERVLDVGCGVGGTSFFLAREMNCLTTGISVSDVQVRKAQVRAKRLGLEQACRFFIADASHLPLSGRMFDVVWTVECSEHLEDKAAFFKSVLPLLRPGGRIATAAWVKTQDDPLVQTVCRSFLCPNLATADDYARWIPNSRVMDITPHVIRTWNLCRKVGFLFRFVPLTTNGRAFVNGFEAIERAYSTGKMRYVLVAGAV
jgi:tocopherol O-methyltransferase